MLKDKSNGSDQGVPIFSRPPIQTWFPSMVDEDCSPDYISTFSGETSAEEPITFDDAAALENVYRTWISGYIENFETYRIPFWKNEKTSWTETICHGIGSTVSLFPQTSDLIGEFRPESYSVSANAAWISDWSKVSYDLCQSLIRCQRTEPENVGTTRPDPWENFTAAVRTAASKP
jgi:hypothetical protein